MPSANSATWYKTEGLEDLCSLMYTTLVRLSLTSTVIFSEIGRYMHAKPLV